MYPWRVSGADFVQGGRGKKDIFFSHCMPVCNLLTRRGKKDQRGSFAWSSAYPLNIKTEDYIG